MFKKMITLSIIISMLLNIGSISYGETDMEEVISKINDLRIIEGIDKIDDNYELKNTALTHSKYMAYYDTLTSTEESGNLYYRGRYTQDRAAYYNYEEPYVVEMIMYNNNSIISNIDALIENPYSRVHLLDPKYQDIGIKEYDKYFSFILGGEGRKINKEVNYPYDNQINIPITWINNYRYSPYSALGISSYGNGIPITYSYYSKEDDVDNIIVNDISISTTNNTSKFNYKVLTPKDDKYLNNSIVIVPTESYKYGTTYKITLDLTVEFDRKNSISIKKSFSFQTEKDPSIISASNAGNSLISRADFTQKLVNALNYTVLEPTTMTFNDVDINSVYGKYIYTAYYNNLIKGKSSTSFEPTLYITRQEMYTILVRAYEGKIGKAIEYTEEYPINSFMNISSWAIDNKCIVKAYAAGFLVTNSFNNVIGTGQVTEIEYDIIIKAFKESLNNY